MDLLTYGRKGPVLLHWAWLFPSPSHGLGEGAERCRHAGSSCTRGPVGR